MNAVVRSRRNSFREREVMCQLKECRMISVFWLQDPCTRWAALNRMEKHGKISVKIIGYPMYRVTIHRPNAISHVSERSGDNVQ